MKRIFSLILLIAIAFSINNTHAQAPAKDRWVLVATTRDTLIYIDRQTIRYRPEDANYIIFWDRIVESSGKAQVTRSEVHRTSRMYRFLSMINYAPSGEITFSSSTPSGWMEIVPDSVAEAEYNWLFSSASGVPGTRL